MAWRGRFCDRCGAGTIEMAHDCESGVCLEVAGDAAITDNCVQMQRLSAFLFKLS